MKRAHILAGQIETRKMKQPKDIVTMLIERDQPLPDGTPQPSVDTFNQQLFDAACVIATSYPIEVKKHAAELVKDSPHPDEWPAKDFGPMNETPALINSFNLIYTRFAKFFEFPVPTDPNDFIL